MSGIINSAGSKSGVIGPQTIDIFYNAYSESSWPNENSGYIQSHNMESASAYCTGVIPAQMLKITEILAYTQDAQNYHAPYGEQALKWEWDIAGNGEDINTHSMAEATLSGTWQQVDDRLRSKSVMSVGSVGSRFEDLASSSDAFGMRFNRTSSVALYLLGVKISYEVKNK
jgi:hypothetical protein